ncbi:MAG TPA: malonate decarboxylase holo-[acyl-carrier-protein] synthase [Ferrovaceae bacterium]|uniref:phosphoribosyl-dephospho-CoA transferase MdcG domain-containing protein n=1 Tax=Ferrovum sp. JA12 TaxID=1356299 RepID=UPI00070325A8|nr:phosphoribosyl-dephospho-CoA transferase MdcG domain-containing protein [Ferrovum sp. JA12]HQT81922.1 malonate decarboxylase holo-[acyl-carrier-protein] synthase [Ferrovaceae bacterium]HQU07075.1 malonate decarboxylase holo-[acyl-carrier-protein] synthase [Ferrovaceae bacterium]
MALDESCAVKPAHQRPFVELWQQSGYPFWLTRESNATHCQVGITHYTETSKERIKVSIPWQALKHYQAPPRLEEVLTKAPASWHSLLQAIVSLAEPYGVTVRVYGALVMAAWLGGGQLRPDSDVDLLFIPTQGTQLKTFLVELERLTLRLPNPRVDGEVRWLNQDVPWREYLKEDNQPCLIKSVEEVKWVARKDLSQALKQERLFLSQIAIQALYDELMLYPKPGLVSPLDKGSHSDMDVPLLWRSIQSLRHYFLKMVSLGQQQVSFERLRQEGVRAEKHMLTITGGVNTYRGAIFHLGLLLAARASQPITSASNICARILDLWGDELAQHQRLVRQRPSHGQLVYQRWKRPGALEMALSGYQLIVREVLPFYQHQRITESPSHARSATLLLLMAEVDDSTLLWRGGEQALLEVQQEARHILAMGSLAQPPVWARYVAFHYQLVGKGLSPGGSADLLSFTLALDRYAAPPPAMAPRSPLLTPHRVCA